MNGTTLSSLVLCCIMTDHYVNLIDKLVDIAVCQGVEDLDLETKLDQIYQRPGTSQRPDTSRYKFPLFLFTDGKGLSLLKLKLGQCTLNIPIGFDGFKSVVELSFSQMRISDDMIQTLLENCPKLKSFHLSHCWGVSSLKIVSQDLELRDMEIHYCLPITCIELVAPKLQKFRYAGGCIPMVFASVPPIEHAWLNCHDRKYAGSFEYILGKSSIDFPLLTSLIIEIATYPVKESINSERPSCGIQEPQVSHTTCGNACQ